MDRDIVLFANSKYGATTSKLISSAHPVVLFRAWQFVAWTSCLRHMLKSKPCSVVFGMVRVQICGHACSARGFASVVLRWFCFVLERRDMSHCCLPNMSYHPPANVCLFSNAPPADWHVTQKSATPAFRRPYHAGEEPELVRRFQVPDPTLWVAKVFFCRTQLAYLSLARILSTSLNALAFATCRTPRPNGVAAVGFELLSFVETRHVNFMLQVFRLNDTCRCITTSTSITQSRNYTCGTSTVF